MMNGGKLRPGINFLGDTIKTVTNGDFDNTTYPTGMYHAKHWANNPYGIGYDCCVFCQNFTPIQQGGTTISIKQTTIRHNDSTLERWYNNGTWSSWVKLLTEGIN